VQDAADDIARLSVFKIADGESGDVFLNAEAKVGDQALTRLADGLRQREGGDPLKQCRPCNDANDLEQQIAIPLWQDPIDEELGRGWKNKAG
jgi:hypothetical protein